MEGMRGARGAQEVRTARDDARRRLAVGAGMLILLVGLALLFVANAPS